MAVSGQQVKSPVMVSCKSNSPVELLVHDAALEKLKAEAENLRALTLTARQLCDIEMLMNGGFTPLDGFLTEEDYNSVLDNVRLANGKLWPMPITLDVTEKQAEGIAVGDRLSLLDDFGNLMAVMTVKSKWVPDKKREAEKIFGSPDDECHPAIAYLFQEAGNVYLGGPVEGVQLPIHYDYNDLRLTPLEVRGSFRRCGFTRVCGFQTRNPMHRSHRELTLRAARDAKANILIHPVVGMTKPGDVDYFTRVRVYLEILKTYPPGMAMVSLLPLAMRMAGPREALWHALIRRNYGCTHFVIGRDHAGPGKNRDGKNFYGDYDAQNFVRQFGEEVGINILTYNHMVYVEDRGEYYEIDKVPEGCSIKSISGTELRRRLQKGIPIPDWFSFERVVKILRDSYPPRHKQGFTVFFTGFSGSGKSTIASALGVALMEDGRRPCITIDGEEARKHLSTELGFSKDDRNMNIRRLSWVAAQVTKARGIAVVCAIAPYESSRQYGRRLVEATGGGFVLVHVATPIEVCEKRDGTGIYKKARSGELKNITGVDDPYDVPKQPDITIDASQVSVREAVHSIVLHLEAAGYLASEQAGV
eukprot:CAMPEP_0119131056 /NCGR_PEP_ID=MMETSP1310-20130426/9334_1 /TAXON_ID=464262 /ORGANISM="Genus nov. species nov., Strain RCC2339" /LENGTH=587 /DNA_ID=CAMNT_0007121609 /DNA_START=71 /DNA_END=1834 /DNA_ORIENTATION=-